MLPQAVSDYRRAQQRLLITTLAVVRREWLRMGEDLDAGWAASGPRMVTLTAAAQVGAARIGSGYVGQTLDELNQAVEPDGEVVATALTGAQSIDGLTYGSLDDLLFGAVVKARQAKAGSLTERLAVGARHLEQLVRTQVSDAGK